MSATEDFADEGGEGQLSSFPPLSSGTCLVSLAWCGRGEGSVIVSVISAIIILIA